RIGLCARYWHFLLGVWIVLLAALAWLTPELVNYICGRG
ncbi:bb3-type cytochrome oxidase subunit III, partial [Cupriavidus sp. CER94]